MQYEFTNRFKKKVENTLYPRLSANYEIKPETTLSSHNITVVVDLQIKNSNNIYLIEYEIHRADPSNNIAKIAYWLTNNEVEQAITVIQIFSPHYELLRGGRSSKQILAEYLGQVLIKRSLSRKYHPIYLRSFTRKNFEKVYTSFPKGKKPMNNAISQLNIIADKAANTISEIVMK